MNNINEIRVSETPTAPELARSIRKFNKARTRLLKHLALGEFKSITDLCTKARVNRATYYSALEDEEFRQAIREQGKIIATTSVPKIMAKIVEQAVRGSFPQQKLVMDTVGLTNSENTTVNNNTFVLTRGEDVRVTEVKPSA